jgi:ABC-type Fe3+ transport system permease subunit
LSRPLVWTALAVFALVSLGPLLAMGAEVSAADLGRLFDPRLGRLLWRTTELGLGAAALALALGLPFGFLVARTDLPGARWLRTLAVVPLLLPPLFLAMTWAVITDWRGLPAAIWVLGLAGFPLVAVFAARAAERVDGRLEEAARLSGGWRAALRVHLSLVLPPAAAGACLVFVFAVSDFAVPDYVSSVGPKFNVYADEIFSSWMQVGEPGLAVAKSLPLIALNLLALVPALWLRRRGSLATVTPGFQTPGTIGLGSWRWPCFALALATVATAGLLPILRLGYEVGGGTRVFTDQRVGEVLAGLPPRPVPVVPTAPQTAIAGLAARAARPAAAAPEDAAPGEALPKAPARPWSERLEALPTLLSEHLTQARAAFRTAFDRARSDLAASYRSALLAATAATALGLVLGHAIARLRRRPLARGLELLALAPLAAPATLFGIGTIVLWARPATQAFYEGPALPAVLLVGRLCAFAVLIVAGSAAAVDRSLEDAAAVAGVGPARRLARIVTPLVRGSLFGSWALVFAFAMRELDAAILVPAANRSAIVRVYNGVHFGRDDYVAALALVLVLSVLLPGLLWTGLSRRRMEVLP